MTSSIPTLLEIRTTLPEFGNLFANSGRQTAAASFRERLLKASPSHFYGFDFRSIQGVQGGVATITFGIPRSRHLLPAARQNPPHSSSQRITKLLFLRIKDCDCGKSGKWHMRCSQMRKGKIADNSNGKIINASHREGFLDTHGFLRRLRRQRLEYGSRFKPASRGER